MNKQQRIKSTLACALTCVALVVGAVSLSGCATGIIQGIIINNAPDFLATMFGQFETRAEFKETQPYFQKRDWLGLVVLARQRLDRDPNRGEWWQFAGYGHMQLGEMKEARDCFARTVKLLPEEAGAWNLYAYSLKALGDRSAALRAVERSIQADPSLGVSYVILGELQREAGRVTPATQAYERALAIDNMDVFAWYGLGLLAKKEKDGATYDKARQALRHLYAPMAEQLEKA